VLILKEVKAFCFDTLLQVFISKGLVGEELLGASRIVVKRVLKVICLVQVGSERGREKGPRE
jgi:hypothetical protein